MASPADLFAVAARADAVAKPMQAELSDAALPVLAYLEDDPSEPLADFALGPMRSAGPGKVMFELIDLREPRKQWRDRADLHRAAQQPLELLAPAPVKVAQPSVRHRGPRRGHVRARRRPRAVSRVSSRGGDSGDPHLDDPEQQPLNQRRSHPRHDKRGVAK